MQRCDITWAILQLKALGIHDVLHFDFLSPPPSDAIVYAVRTVAAFLLDIKLILSDF